MKAENTLYYGDNLDILRRYVDDESVNLIYLDPPFNSNADYNVLFTEKDGTQAHAQIKAFEDTWTWDIEAAQEYTEVLRSGHKRVATGSRVSRHRSCLCCSPCRSIGGFPPWFCHPWNVRVCGRRE